MVTSDAGSCARRGSCATRSREPFILRSRRTRAISTRSAACVRVQMGALDRLLQRHRSLAACYLSAYRPAPGPSREGGACVGWHWFVIRTSGATRSGPSCASAIDSRVGFFEPLAVWMLSRHRRRGGRYPEAERLWRESLALPIGPHMEEQGARRVSAAVRDFFALRSPS